MHPIVILAGILISASGARADHDLAEVAALVNAGDAEVGAAAQRLAVARLHAALERARIVQSEIDVVDQLQRVLDEDSSVVLMPHEVVRLRAERSQLTSQLEAMQDESLSLRARLGAQALDAAEQPWVDPVALDVRALSQAAQKSANPETRTSAASRVEAVAAKIATAQHRIDDDEQSVLPDLADALTSALIDLPDGGSMLDVIEALERAASVRMQVVELQLERERALVQLELLTGAPLPAARETPELIRVGGL